MSTARATIDRSSVLPEADHGLPRRVARRRADDGSIVVVAVVVVVASHADEGDTRASVSHSCRSTIGPRRGEAGGIRRGRIINPRLGGTSSSITAEARMGMGMGCSATGRLRRPFPRPIRGSRVPGGIIAPRAGAVAAAATV